MGLIAKRGVQGWVHGAHCKEGSTGVGAWGSLQSNYSIYK